MLCAVTAILTLCVNIVLYIRINTSKSNAHPIQIKEETYYTRVCHHFYYTDFSIQIQTGQRDDIQIHLVGFSTYIGLPFTTEYQGTVLHEDMQKCRAGSGPVYANRP